MSTTRASVAATLLPVPIVFGLLARHFEARLRFIPPARTCWAHRSRTSPGDPGLHGLAFPPRWLHGAPCLRWLARPLADHEPRQREKPGCIKDLSPQPVQQVHNVLFYGDSVLDDFGEHALRKRRPAAVRNFGLADTAGHLG